MIVRYSARGDLQHGRYACGIFVHSGSDLLCDGLVDEDDGYVLSGHETPEHFVYPKRPLALNIVEQARARTDDPYLLGAVFGSTTK